MKHCLTLKDYSKNELLEILELAKELKRKQKAGEPHTPLAGKTLAMIFQKPSNRTRISFEVGITQLGGKALNIRPDEVQMGAREPIADLARVLSRYVDAAMLRVNAHEDIEEFARFSSIPIINGLSELYHPCQVLADMQTIEEKKGRLAGIKLCYIGDGNNVCNSLINAANILGLEIVVSCPERYKPDSAVLNGGYAYEVDPQKAAKNADVLYTDVWVSMGDEAETEKRLNDFASYQVNAKIVAQAKRDVIFMHCLPAHRGLEVSDEVVEGPHSVIFDQAENRLHAQKALMCKLLG